MLLEGKKVAIGVTGGIAAYKACEVVRLLKKLGAEVRVAMTDSAQKFVTELTFATLSEQPVLTSVFTGNEKSGVPHIDLARWCDLLLICPATANVLAKVATGVADDAIGTTVLATRAKVVFCPAMNSAMWEKPVVQRNVATLRDFGYEILPPEWGRLATVAEGEGLGRLVSPERIVRWVQRALLGTTDLAGKKVLVTAGHTKEALDPVRFLSNHASGKMGFALCEAAKNRGAEVVLVSGVAPSPAIDEVKFLQVTTAEQMRSTVEQEYPGTDILLMAAAVADYRPKEFSKHKLKKGEPELVLHLEKTPDILAELGRKKASCFHVGFALETHDALASATKKLHAKNLDMIVLNNPLEAGAGFGLDTNVVTLITPDGEVEKLPKLSKPEVANVILQRVVAALRHSLGKVAAG